MKLHQFYLIPTIGVAKFVGYDDDGLLFDRYDRSQFKDDGWILMNRIKLNATKVLSGLRKRSIRPIPPPQ